MEFGQACRTGGWTKNFDRINRVKRNRPKHRGSVLQLMMKKDLLTEPIEHIDITGFNAVGLIESMSRMSFSARELAAASMIFDRMISEESCTVVLSLAGSTSAADA